MPRKKITKEVADETPTIVEEEIIETQVDGDSEVTEEYKKLAELIEDYKIKNPVKYEQKKEALQKQLNSLK